VLYVKRWLKAPIQMPDGRLVERDTGTLRAGYVQLNINRLMTAQGYVQRGPVWPGDRDFGGPTLRINADPLIWRSWHGAGPV